MDPAAPTTPPPRGAGRLEGRLDGHRQPTFAAGIDVEEILLAEVKRASATTRRRRRAEEKLAQPLRVLDGTLAGRKFLLGNAFSIADLNVASVLSWALLAKVDLTRTPNAERWLKECCARPAFAKAQRG